MARAGGADADPRTAWERLYAKHGLQYGGQGEPGMLTRVLRRGALVLDVGCGDGKTAETLARDYEVVGCDFSRAALTALRSERPHLDSLELVECRLPYLSFGSEKFDAVACVHVLSHLDGRGRVQAAEQLSALIKRGGYLFVEVFGCDDLRFGQGEEVEPRSFVRGNGIMTHYFEPGEVPALFPGLECVAEVRDVRHVSFGAVAGKRDIIRVLARR